MRNSFRRERQIVDTKYFGMLEVNGVYASTPFQYMALSFFSLQISTQVIKKYVDK